MDAEKLLDALHIAERLKDATRHCYTSGGRHESVAEHSWRMTLMAFFIRDEFPEADMDKVMRMCLIHDLGEAFTGDIPTFDKTQSDEDLEETLLRRWVDALPAPRPLFLAASLEESTGDVILKAVNVREAAVTAEIACAHAGCMVEELSAMPDAENTLDAPDAIRPEVHQVPGGPGVTHTFPPHSVTVLRMKAGG